MAQFKSSPNSEGGRLLELVSHLTALKADREKLNKHLDFFVSRFVYPKLRDYQLTYITAPFWSQIEKDPIEGGPGYWYDATCYVSQDRAEEIIPSYAVFFACILDTHLIPFSLARLVSPQTVHKIPLVIDIHRKKGRWSRRCWPRRDLVSFYQFRGHDAAEARLRELPEPGELTPARLRIESPYLPELELNYSERAAAELELNYSERAAAEKERLLSGPSGPERRLIAKLPFEWFRDDPDLVMRMRRMRSQRLKEVFDGEEFRAYCDRLLDDCAREQFRERLQLDQWEREKVEGLARFLVTYNIVAGNWRYAYHLPSKVSKEERQRNKAEAEVGSGGPIFATYKPVPPSRLAQLSLGTNLEFRSLALDDHRRKAVDDVAREARRSALAAIMSRNMSHNIGSHVLASSDLLDGVHTLEVQKFHGFLQQRMDFIAQVVTYTPSWGEPMFFFKDVLQGFFNQYLLLGHLIKDQGYNMIRFLVESGGREWAFALADEERCQNKECNRVKEVTKEERQCHCRSRLFAKGGRWVLQGAEQPDDFLVAIPGGNTGVHALYDILENILRNSAKYGIHPESENNAEFKLHVSVEEREDRYLLSIWDNVSDAGQCVLRAGPCSCRVCKVQKNLKRDLITDMSEGALEIHSHGVHEMKECARILAYPHESTEPGWDVRAGGRNGDPAHFWADAGDSGKHLTHRFFLQKPRLAGIADLSVAGAYVGTDEAHRTGAYCYTKLDDMVAHSHQLGAIIMPAGRGQRADVFRWIKDNYCLLPCRLLVFTADVGECLREASEFNLPPRRVRWCGLEELPSLKGSTSEEWENLVIRLYELWVEKFKSLDTTAKRRLVIAFDRAESSIFQQWEQALEGFRRGFNSKLVEVDILQTVTDRDGKTDVTLKASSTGQTEEDLFETIHTQPETILLFDNHNKAMDAIGRYRPENGNRATTRKLGFYHPFEGKNLKLFQSLMSPPLQPFAVRSFILSLLEGALTNVLVVDERVAEATFSRSDGFNIGLLPALNAVKCFPVYFVWTAPDQRTSISEEIDLRDNFFRTKKPGASDTINEAEGLYLGDPETRVEVQESSDETRTLGTDFFDFIIIHQGVIDRLKEADRWDEEQHLKQLYRLSPSVVITSGRGRTLRYVPRQIPFLEFSILRENTYFATSKYHLARALFSVSGR